MTALQPETNAMAETFAPVAGVSVPADFLAWFDRAWLAYEDKSFASVITSKSWALKAWREQGARIAEFERILDGVTPEMIDGGWTARGISAYAQSLESRIAELELQIAGAAQ